MFIKARVGEGAFNNYPANHQNLKRLLQLEKEFSPFLLSFDCYGCSVCVSNGVVSAFSGLPDIFTLDGETPFSFGWIV